MIERLRNFMQKHFWKMCIVLLSIFILGYFINIIFFQNKKDIFTILILTENVDHAELTATIEKVISLKDKEEIVIQTLNYDNPINQGVAITWLRSGTVDLLIGNEMQMTIFGQYGYLSELGKIGFKTNKEKFMCAVAEFDTNGNIVQIGKKNWVGVYLDKVAGINGFSSPVAALMPNAPNRENAIKVLNLLCSDESGVNNT